MKTLKLAFFMHDFSCGGVERMRLRLLPELAARGHAVFLVVQHATGPLRDKLDPVIRLVDLHQDTIRGSILPLAQWLRRERPDVFISSLDHNNIAALLARELAGVSLRMIICQHNTLSAERSLGWKYRLIPMLYRTIGRRADAIVAVSHGVADDLRQTLHVGAERIAVIYNPVLQSPVCPNSVAPPHPWLEDAAIPCLIFAGRLVAQKDPVLLLEAFARRLRYGPARLVLLGDGDLRAALERRARELGIDRHVLFAGFVPDPLPWMMHAAAAVVTSRYEGFGNVIVEALACGTPVVATDCPHGPAEILRNGTFGRLIPVGDVAALSAAMQEDLRAAFPVENLRRRAHEFTVAACADRHEALFSRLLSVRTHNVFNLALSGLTAAEVAHRLVNEPASNTQLVVTPNLDHLRLLRRPSFAAAYAQAKLVCADGFPIALYAWLRGAGPRWRVTGCDIFHALANDPDLRNRQVVIIVEAVLTADRLGAWISQRGFGAHWTVEVAARNMMGLHQEQQRLAKVIRQARPDILVLTLGAPVSEEFVQRYRNELPPCWAICVGQAVRVELGLVRRAPNWLRACGLEWAWRLCREPHRLAIRYVRAALYFPWAVARDIKH